MTVNASWTATTGKVVASKAGPMTHQVELPGPPVASKQLDETASDGLELTPIASDNWLMRLKVPAANAGVYYWCAEARISGDDPAVTATSAIWLDPGEDAWLFVPDGYQVVVADALP